MKIFLHLLLIGLVLSLMSTAPAISYEFDEELPPDVTYQWLQSILEIASKKGIGTSSCKIRFEDSESRSQWDDYRIPGSHPEIWHKSPK